MILLLSADKCLYTVHHTQIGLKSLIHLVLTTLSIRILVLTKNLSQYLKEVFN